MSFPRPAVIALAAAALVPLSHAQDCGTNEICDPQPFVWTEATETNGTTYYSGTMEISEATFTIGGETITTRAYGQAGQPPTIPGPTMFLKPGFKYVLRFHNQLPYEAPSPEHNVFKDPNISNLHTHGLHISGESPGDDVTRSFEGGFGGDFVYDMPADHMGGTFWYHAHHHGSTFLQVSAGAFGLMIVDDSGDGIPANVAAMTERQLVVAFLDPGVAGTGGDTLITGTLAPTWTVNGKVRGDLYTPPDTWQHWRLLLADRDAKAKTVSVGSSCEVALLARDGVWRTTAPKILTDNDISLTGASRADLAVRCSGNSTIAVDGTTVANVVVSGNAGDPAVGPYANGSTWSALRPDYLRDLRGVASVNQEKVRMGARTINGSQFDKNVPTFSLPANQVQEWAINGAAKHPFHLHVYHVQSLGCGGDFEDGEYYDVIASNCAVRFDLNEGSSSPYSGRTIMHCHILAHEDQGAMGWLEVVGGQAPPTFPADDTADPPFGEYYAISTAGEAPAAPSGLSAAAASSSSITLAWTDNSSNEEGFEIERAAAGSGLFALLVSLGIDASGYTDTGLGAEESYDYRVRAFNGVGDSAWSSIATATTDASSGSNSVSVGALVVGTDNLGKGLKTGYAEIVVVDNDGNPVPDATVSGDFFGTFIETASGTTDAAGVTRVTTTGSAKGSVTVGFCVTAISHPTLEDFAGEVCAGG